MGQVTREEAEEVAGRRAVLLALSGFGLILHWNLAIRDPARGSRLACGASFGGVDRRWTAVRERVSCAAWIQAGTP